MTKLRRGLIVLAAMLAALWSAWMILIIFTYKCLTQLELLTVLATIIATSSWILIKNGAHFIVKLKQLWRDCDH